MAAIAAAGWAATPTSEAARVEVRHRLVEGLVGSATVERDTELIRVFLYASDGVNAGTGVAPTFADASFKAALNAVESGSDLASKGALALRAMAENFRRVPG